MVLRGQYWHVTSIRQFRDLNPVASFCSFDDNRVVSGARQFWIIITVIHTVISKTLRHFLTISAIMYLKTPAVDGLVSRRGTELDWDEMNWAELNWAEVNWTELNWTEQSWTELKWTEQSWTELSWTEMSWTAAELRRTELRWTELNWTEMSWTDWT